MNSGEGHPIERLTKRLLIAALTPACALAVALPLAAKGPGAPTDAPSIRYIEGTNGPDRLQGTPRAEAITGYGGADRIDGGGGNDFIDGREGGDRITTPVGPGAAALHGGQGDDRLLARGEGSDSMHGMGGHDRLGSGPGNDALLGGPGEDVLMDLLGDNRLRGQGGDDRLQSGAGADRLDGDGGSDRLDGGPGDDLMEGGPGYDGLRGGAGDDHLSDGSLGSDLLEGGPGDDLIRSAPRGMDRVRCGSGQDRVEADWWDIVAPDCEVVTRPEADPRLGPEAGTLLPVYSLRGELLGSTGSRRLSETGGPLRLLWANNGHLYLESAFRGAGHCFIALTPSSGGRSGCNDARGLARGGSMFVRRAGGASYRWFAFAPAWARTLQVGARRVPVWDGVAVFVAGRRPGPVIARGDGRTLGLNVP